MTQQYGEIDRTDYAGPLKTRRTVMEVIRQIRSEKQDRNGERCDLARSVRGYVVFSYERITGE